MSMYQAVLSRQDSSLVTLSSDDAKEVDVTYGNGKFKCNLMNTNRGGTHAIKIVPNLVMVPNVFNNVFGTSSDGYMNTFASLIAGVGHQYSIPFGFYTRDELVNVFNADDDNEMPAAVVMAVSAYGYIQFSNSTGVMYTVVMKQAMANMLGFTNTTLFPVTVNGITVTVNGGTTVTANVLPHMGTTPVVYVATRQFGINRMIASNNRDYNVIATVSMHDVPYGSYGVFRGQDIFMDDIEFRSPRSLDQVDVELLDSNYNTLTIDTRFEVILQLKVFHTDTTK